jgi:hypothetical protein
MFKTLYKKYCIICLVREFKDILSNILLKGCGRGVALMSLYGCKGNCLNSPNADL